MSDVFVQRSIIDKKGLFAARNFKKGEIVLKWKSKKKLTKKQLNQLPESEKHFVDGHLEGIYLLQVEPDRYMNHSCEPNTKVGDNCDIAIRDIKNGEEITSDYSDDPKLPVHFLCNCGSKNCKGKI